MFRHQLPLNFTEIISNASKNSRGTIAFDVSVFLVKWQNHACEAPRCASKDERDMRQLHVLVGRRTSAYCAPLAHEGRGLRRTSAFLSVRWWRFYNCGRRTALLPRSAQLLQIEHSVLGPSSTASVKPVGALKRAQRTGVYRYYFCHITREAPLGFVFVSWQP